MAVYKRPILRPKDPKTRLLVKLVHTLFYIRSTSAQDGLRVPCYVWPSQPSPWRWPARRCYIPCLNTPAQAHTTQSRAELSSWTTKIRTSQPEKWQTLQQTVSPERTIEIDTIIYFTTSTRWLSDVIFARTAEHSPGNDALARYVEWVHQNIEFVAKHEKRGN